MFDEKGVCVKISVVVAAAAGCSMMVVIRN